MHACIIYCHLTLCLFWLEGAAAGGVTPITAGVMTAGDTAGVMAAGDTAGITAGAGPSTAAMAPG